MKMNRNEEPCHFSTGQFLIQVHGAGVVVRKKGTKFEDDGPIVHELIVKGRTLKDASGKVLARA